MILTVTTHEVDGKLRGIVGVPGAEFDTTGTLGVSRSEALGIPVALTFPSTTSLATGRVIRFIFASVLVGTLLIRQAASALNGHLRT